MKQVLVLIVLLVSIVALAGCHPRKAPPVEPGKEVKAPGEQVTRELPAQKPPEKPITPIQPAEGEESALKDIHFEYDKYNLTDEAASLMGQNADYMMKSPEVNVLIEGHCDERGTEEYNIALGEKRALAARDYLVRFGIDKSRISIISYGEERPLDPASNEEAWAKNRRDHLVIK
jgi:peptidoglycan-associated lipoprotein